MTCLAYRNGTLAADTQITCGDMIYPGKAIKIARRDDGVLVGGSGAGGYCDAFIEWVLSGEDGEPPEIQSSPDGHPMSEGVLIRPNGTLEIFTDTGVLMMKPDYWAAGTGAPFALGAMHAGASAEQAVEAAAAHDIACSAPAFALSH